jgi:hypothetical protein
MARKKHPKKEIEEALQYAESHGWRLVLGGGHAWGKLYFPHNMKNAVVVISASSVSGARPKMPPIMRVHCVEWLTIVCTTNRRRRTESWNTPSP